MSLPAPALLSEPSCSSALRRGDLIRSSHSARGHRLPKSIGRPCTTRDHIATPTTTYEASHAEKELIMSKTTPEQNKALVLEGFDTLFNKRDYSAAERFWSSNYIQHSAHISPGREGLFNLVRSVPETMHYENQLIVAEGDYVIAHGRFTGMGR